MSDVIRSADRPELLADIAAQSGDLVRLHDRRLNLDIIDQAPDWELQVNRQTRLLKLEFHQDSRGLLETIARTQHFGGHSQGWTLQVGRIMVPGESSLHIQYRIKRVRLQERVAVPGPNPYELEMPLWIDTSVGALTRMNSSRRATRCILASASTCSTGSGAWPRARSRGRGDV